MGSLGPQHDYGPCCHKAKMKVSNGQAPTTGIILSRGALYHWCAVPQHPRGLITPAPGHVGGAGGGGVAGEEGGRVVSLPCPGRSHNDKSTCCYLAVSSTYLPQPYTLLLARQPTPGHKGSVTPGTSLEGPQNLQDFTGHPQGLTLITPTRPLPGLFSSLTTPHCSE